jgi:hypothetical protein
MIRFINHKSINKNWAHEVQKYLFKLYADRLMMLITLRGLLHCNDPTYYLESGVAWDQLKNYTKYLVSTFHKVYFFIRFPTIFERKEGVNMYFGEWTNILTGCTKQTGGLHTAHVGLSCFKWYTWRTSGKAGNAKRFWEYLASHMYQKVGEN